MTTRRLFKNSFFAIAAKVINALIQLICLPILLNVFGKGNYGLIVIAMSLNTFIAIIQLGLPTGLPKFVAEWLAKDEVAQFNSATQTVSSFYLIIALINFMILLAIALIWPGIFKVNPGQIGTLQSLLIITAITSFLAVPATLLDQILTGAQELWFVSSLEMIKNFFFVGLAAFVYFWPEALCITQFYALRCVLMFLMIPAKLWRLTKHGSIVMFIPGWNFKSVLPLLKYCLSLMTFSIFIAMADKLRPIILGIRIPFDAGEALADYQIINYIRIFLMMISASFMAALIPHLSGATIGGNRLIYGKTIEQGTKYIWTFGALLGFGVIMLSKELLCIYVGPENLYLEIWLIVLVIGALYNLYVSPIASVILSFGKLVPMIFATGIGCLLSLSICWVMAPRFGVGAIAVSLVVYNLVHLLVTHFWYLPRYFNINPSNQIINIMLPPAFIGVVMCCVGRWIINYMGYTNDYINIAIGTICGMAIYMTMIITIYIRPNEIRELFVKLKNT
ncbi:MAG: oligosaccharide flippase family protein [Desulfobacterales bacterium]|nr:oligosaccharide flippase family protein [Desulfobacterales bacterium]